MAIGISGDVQAEVGGQNPQPATTMMLLELRTISNLLYSMIDNPPTSGELNVIRNDQAFELNVTTPLPGANL
jgi:hypothetical protein